MAYLNIVPTGLAGGRSLLRARMAARTVAACDVAYVTVYL